MELGVRSQVVRRHALHEHRSSRLGIDLAWYRDGLGRFDDHVVSEAALATAETPDPLPFVEVGDLRSDLHDQAYALDPSQIRQGDGTDASQTPLRAASEAACRSLQRRSALYCRVGLGSCHGRCGPCVGALWVLAWLPQRPACWNLHPIKLRLLIDEL
jgi:hypothetical protein